MLLANIGHIREVDFLLQKSLILERGGIRNCSNLCVFRVTERAKSATFCLQARTASSKIVRPNCRSIRRATWPHERALLAQKTVEVFELPKNKRLQCSVRAA